MVDEHGRTSGRREGEPSFTGVEDLADAIVAALPRGVDLVVPQRVFDETRDDSARELPPYISVR